MGKKNSTTFVHINGHGTNVAKCMQERNNLLQSHSCYHLLIATQVDPTKQHNHIHIKHENQSLS
jgi:hypothetical protein